MKLKDLSKLDLKRLKAYRRSLIPQVACFTHCDCGSQGCDNAYLENKDNPQYIVLSTELKRVNEELAKRQTLERLKSGRLAITDVYVLKGKLCPSTTFSSTRKKK